MQKILNTLLRNTISDLKLLGLSNGTLILGRIIEVEDDCVRVGFPISLGAQFNKEGTVSGMIFMPYLAPFSRICPFSVSLFNIAQIVSVTDPTKELAQRYERTAREILESVLSETDGIVSTMIH